MLWTRSLVALWRFENTALDASGNGRTGVVTGAVYAAGRIGRNLDFAGGVTTDRVTVAHHASLNPTVGLTLAAWIYPLSSGPSTWARVLQKSVGAALATGYGWYLLTNKMTLDIHGIGGPLSNTAVTYNAWQHIAVTVDGSKNIIYYLNGLADGGGVMANGFGTITTVGPLIIGNRADLIRAWDGLIDEVGFWNRVLTPADIRRTMHAMSPVA